ncbi:hAT family dimerization domain-containing protein, partial [Corallococcus sp. AB038B]|uniref:hAT family dimerization domain-containing protein n=1 Tax=Corallococcus sp. AB038B TaxID=2316718 RepID=UPI001F17DD01
AERSFSVLKLIKNFLRNSMGDDRLSSLALLNIHKTITNKLVPEKLIDEFAKKKRRIKLID